MPTLVSTMASFPAHIIDRQIRAPPVAQNRYWNGECVPYSPTGLPSKERYNKIVTDDLNWFLRGVDRPNAGGGFPYCPDSVCVKKQFKAGALRHHSRRVFADLAKQGHGFAEGCELSAASHPRRRAMARRYEEVVRALPSPVPHRTPKSASTGRLPAPTMECMSADVARSASPPCTALQLRQTEAPSPERLGPPGEAARSRMRAAFGSRMRSTSRHHHYSASLT